MKKGAINGEQKKEIACRYKNNDLLNADGYSYPGSIQLDVEKLYKEKIKKLVLIETDFYAFAKQENMIPLLRYQQDISLNGKIEMRNVFYLEKPVLMAAFTPVLFEQGETTERDDYHNEKVCYKCFKEKGILKNIDRSFLDSLVPDLIKKSEIEENFYIDVGSDVMPSENDRSRFVFHLDAYKNTEELRKEGGDAVYFRYCGLGSYKTDRFKDTKVPKHISVKTNINITFDDMFSDYGKLYKILDELFGKKPYHGRILKVSEDCMEEIEIKSPDEIKIGGGSQ